MNLEKLNMLSQLGTKQMDLLVADYAQWYFISAVGWLVFGSLCFLAGIKIWKMQTEYEHKEITCFGLFAIALLTLPANLPNLFQSKAYAIHCLIQELTK